MGLVEELKELVALKSAGALSDSEFLDAKAAVLAASKAAGVAAAPSPTNSATQASGEPRSTPKAEPKSGSETVATPAKTTKDSKAARKAARKAAKKAAGSGKHAVDDAATARPHKRAKTETQPPVPPPTKPRAGVAIPKYRVSTVEALRGWKVGDIVAGTSTSTVFGGNAGSGTFRTGFPGVGVSCLQVGEDWNPDILRSVEHGEIWTANSPDLCRKADSMQTGYTLPLLTRASKEKSKGSWTFRGWYELVSVQQDESKIRGKFANREVPKSFKKMLASGHKVTLDPEDKSKKFVIGRVCALTRVSSPLE